MSEAGDEGSQGVTPVCMGVNFIFLLTGGLRFHLDAELVWLGHGGLQGHTVTGVEERDREMYHPPFLLPGFGWEQPGGLCCANAKGQVGHVRRHE